LEDRDIGEVLTIILVELNEIDGSEVLVNVAFATATADAEGIIELSVTLTSEDTNNAFRAMVFENVVNIAPAHTSHTWPRVAAE